MNSKDKKDLITDLRTILILADKSWGNHVTLAKDGPTIKSIRSILERIES